MLFPFRSRSIFRNRWIALLWAVGICYTATEIVDSLSGVAGKGKVSPDAAMPVDPADPVAAALGGPAPGDAPAIPREVQ